MIKTYSDPSSEVFGNLRLTSKIFVKCSETLVCSSHNYLRIFGNFQKVAEIFKKSSKTSLYIVRYNVNILRS